MTEMALVEESKEVLQDGIAVISSINWTYHIGGIVQIGIVLALALIVHFAIQLGFPKASKRLKKKRKPGKAPIAETFFSALSLPLRCLIWIIAAGLILDMILDHWTDWQIPSPTPKTLRLATVIAIFWFLLRWKSGVQKAITKQIKKNIISIQRHQLEAVGKLLTLVILALGVVIALQVVGLNLSALVAIGGFGTLAVGLAGKEVFANFFSGVMLYFTHPFNIGDRIQVPEKSIEGIVEDIGWYLTCIRGYDKRPIYVPNSIFSTVQVINGTRQTHRRVRLNLTLRYRDFNVVKPIVEEIDKMLRDMENLEHLPTTTVRLANYGDYALEILVQAFTHAKTWAEFMEIQQEILFQCGEIVHRNGADFAYPTTTISLDQESPIIIENTGKSK